MAAAAGALNVRLEKKGHYKLGPGGAPLTTSTINGALRLVQTAAITWTIICFAVGGIYLAITT
jgi:adenosylcobinamide-phosphate synthase